MKPFDIVVSIFFLLALLISIKTGGATQSLFIILAFLFFVSTLKVGTNLLASNLTAKLLPELKKKVDFEMEKLENPEPLKNPEYRGKYNNIVIPIKTQEEWNSVVQKLLDEGAEWRSREKTLKSYYFKEYRNKTNLVIEKGVLGYGSMDLPYANMLIEEKKYPIINPKEILK